MTTTLTYRMVITLWYYADHTNRDAYRAVRRLKGAQTGTIRALRARELITSSNNFPYTVLTDKGKHVLDNYKTVEHAPMCTGDVIPGQVHVCSR